MRARKQLALAAAVVAAGGCMTASSAQAQERPGDRAAAQQIARMYLQTRADLLTARGSAGVASRLSTIPVSSALRKVLAQDLPEFEARRRALTAANGGFTRATTQVSVKKFRRSGSTAFAVVAEHTKLWVAVTGSDPDYPAAEEYAVDRTITFMLTATGWQLSASALAGPESSSLPSTDFSDQK